MTQGSRDSEDLHAVPLPDDVQLYPRLMANDDEAWRIFYAHYFARLHMYFSNRNVRTIEDREDLVQETFTRFCGTLLSGKYNPQAGALAQWLYGIARNVLNRHKELYVEEYSKQDELSEDHPIDAEATTSTALTEEDENRIASALTQLSEKIRDVVLLKIRVSSDWAWKDIANELGISESAAKMRYQRGIEKLKDLLS